MKIGSSYIGLLQVVSVLFPACFCLPCHGKHGTTPTAYAGFSGPRVFLGYPHSLTAQPYSPSPAYPAYSTSIAQPAPHTYNVVQQPNVLPSLQRPYDASLFHEVTPSLPLPPSQQEVSSHETQDLFDETTPIIPPTPLTVTPHHKRSMTNRTQLNIIEKSPLKEPSGTKQLLSEVYVPEDKYLPPTLHRFPHDTFPYDSKLNNPLLAEESGRNLKNCPLGSSCSPDEQKRDHAHPKDNQRKKNEKAFQSAGLLSLDLNNDDLHGEYINHTDTKNKNILIDDGFNFEMKNDALNVSKPIKTITLPTVNNENTLKNVDLSIDPSHFETHNVYNSKRDTHSMSFVDNSTSIERMERKPPPCRCLQKLKKCVHDARNMADYFVKKACNALGDLDV